MKKLSILFVLVGFLALGCASTNVVPKDPTNYLTDGRGVTEVGPAAKNVEISTIDSDPCDPKGVDPDGPDTTMERPGWGHGDKNHEHSGPPGLDQRGTK